MKTEDPLSVYVVDDDELFLKSLTHQLKEKWQDRIKIKLFHTGEELLKYIQEQKPDIVILDYILNGFYPYAMDGRSVLQKIRQTDPETKVIILSGQDKIEVALDSIKNGAFDYVIKNDNTFFKVQTSIRNAIKSISDFKRLKTYKRWLAAGLLFVGIAITVLMIVKMFFPGIN